MYTVSISLSVLQQCVAFSHAARQSPTSTIVVEHCRYINMEHSFVQLKTSSVTLNNQTSILPLTSHPFIWTLNNQSSFHLDIDQSALNLDIDQSALI